VSVSVAVAVATHVDELHRSCMSVKRVRCSWPEAEPMPLCGSGVAVLWLCCGCAVAEPLASSGGPKRRVATTA
jgi:hypothetical protein